MPYIITTRQSDGPVVAFAADGAPVTSGNRRIEAGEPWPHQPVSHRAVATLEEARSECADYGECILDEQMPEQGWTLGPLPDGTIIVVELISPLMLTVRTPTFSAAGLLACVRSDDYQPLCDAYNEAQRSD